LRHTVYIDLSTDFGLSWLNSRDKISRNGVAFTGSKAEINIYPFFVLPKQSKVNPKLDRTFTKTLMMAMFAYKATLTDTPLKSCKNVLFCRNSE